MLRTWPAKVRDWAPNIVPALVVAIPVFARNLVGIYDTGFTADDCWFEHGWPECFLIRSGRAFYGHENSWDLFPWHPWGREWIISPLALLVDLFVSAAIISLNFRALRDWRARSFRFSLRAVLIAQTLALLVVLNGGRDNSKIPTDAYFWPTACTSLVFNVSLATAAYAAAGILLGRPARRHFRAYLRADGKAGFRVAIYALRMLGGTALAGLWCAGYFLGDFTDVATFILGIAIAIRWRRANAVIVGLGAIIALLSILALFDAECHGRLVAVINWYDWFEQSPQEVRVKWEMFRAKWELLLIGLGLHLGVCYSWWCQRRARNLGDANF
ncbi:MAG TPA: hypothetical protein VHV08_07750 [Pirellulales bacterium]|nr:hypothetical protein [Pirellulales bacterium]